MNRVSIQYTVFVDLDSDGNEVHRHYGFRIYDDYQAEYNNGFVSFGELQETVNQKNIWKFLEDNYPDFYDTTEFISRGAFLNDDWLSLEKEE